MPKTPPSSATPFWIGDDATAIFAWLHTPTDTPVRSTGVVIVSPLGYEAICAHSALRELAIYLSAAGFPVLRYDHPGAGDSAGSDADPNRVESWIDGIARAIDELEHRTGVREVSVIGLRMGALLALKAATARSDVKSLVLWAPPTTGRAYVRELAALGAFRSAANRGPDLDEVTGFQFSPETRAALARLHPLSSTLAPDTDVLLIPRDDLPASAESPFLGFVPNVNVVGLPGFSDALRDPHEARTAPALLEGVFDF